MIYTKTEMEKIERVCVSLRKAVRCEKIIVRLPECQELQRFLAPYAVRTNIDFKVSAEFYLESSWLQPPFLYKVYLSAERRCFIIKLISERRMASL